MFAPSPLGRSVAPSGAQNAAPACPRRRLETAAILRLTLLLLSLAGAPPEGASAQALGTMQVTARVLPGRPPWAGVREAQDLVERVRRSPSSDPVIRRAGLVHARADVVSAAGRRRLLITVNFPRN